MNFVRPLAASIFCAWIFCICIFCACMLPSAVWAQSYPERPVTIVVAFAPGGADDATARILQDPMQKALGQPIVVENVSGAGGMIAAAKVAHADPDGYTILLHQDALAAGMTLYPDRTFDAMNDFVPIGLINTAPTTLAGRPTLPPNTIDELLRWMKEPGRNVKIGHPGVGSFGHLADALICQELGWNVTQVPYRGGVRRWWTCCRARST
jgi:tripartite-type tricarboxylate transporter receptor subunit TctC